MSIVVVIGGDVPVLKGVYGSGELALRFGSRDPPTGIRHWERNSRGYDRLRITLRVTAMEAGGEEANAASAQHPVLGPTRETQGCGLTVRSPCKQMPVPLSRSAGNR